jgi:hypothetical protein
VPVVHGHSCVLRKSASEIFELTKEIQRSASRDALWLMEVALSQFIPPVRAARRASAARRSPRDLQHAHSQLYSHSDPRTVAHPQLLTHNCTLTIAHSRRELLHHRRQRPPCAWIPSDSYANHTSWAHEIKELPRQASRINLNRVSAPSAARGAGGGGRALI